MTDSYQNLMGNSNHVKNELDKILARSIHGKLINFEKTVRPIHTQFSANKSEKILLHKSMAIGVT